MTVVLNKRVSLWLCFLFVFGVGFIAAEEGARLKLFPVLVGERVVPKHNEEGGAAYARYRAETQAWLAALERGDCEFLLDEMKKRGQHHSLEHGLWLRYGELDHKAAIRRLGGDEVMTPAGRGKRHWACDVLEGWGRRDPAAAWVYYNRWWDVHGEHPLHLAGEVHDMVLGIFQNWVVKDVEGAFGALVKINEEDFRGAALGYYWGLGLDVDFKREAGKLRKLFEEPDGVAAKGWSSGPEGPRLVLGRSFASKWARRDADAAIEWWMEWDEKGLRDQGFRTSAEVIWRREGFWLGELLVEWCGEQVEGDPDGVLDWLRANPEWLERREVMEKVIPVLVKFRADEVVLLFEKEGSDGEMLEMIRGRVVLGGVEDAFRRVGTVERSGW